jgi:hypothetical protein
MVDFRKLGTDRNAVAISKAMSPGIGTGGIITGDITRGEVVSVSVSDSTTGTASVKSRRTGALPLNQPFDDDQVQWAISGTALTVTLDTDNTGTMKFWVF